METSPQILAGTELPGCLEDLPQPPPHLYLTGALPKRPMIAVVGTRRPTEQAELFTRTLAQQLVSHGFAVVSGGAAGIDTAAHEGALAAAGPTLVVAPAGWHEPYPESNRGLFRQIVSNGGGYVSLVEPDKKALTPNFFARNAVLVALARATIVIQAPLRSGARNSAHVARKIGRLLFVVPSAPWIEAGAGCIVELRLGARPLGGLSDLLAGLAEHGVYGSRDPLQLELPLDRPNCGTRARRSQSSEKSRNLVPAADVPNNWGGLSELSPVTEALEQGCNTLDSICLRSGWNAPKVQSALLRLTLTGFIRITSVGRIEVLTR